MTLDNNIKTLLDAQAKSSMASLRVLANGHLDRDMARKMYDCTIEITKILAKKHGFTLQKKEVR